MPPSADDLAAKGSDHQLRQYWTHGEGAVKIGWGTPGDFDRCVMHLGKYVRDPKGLCAEYHHQATGEWPAEHAAHEHGKAAEALTVEERAFLEQMALKHLRGLHDQRTHGRHSAANRARQATQELDELREAVSRAQAHMGGRPLREDHTAADRRLIGDRLRRHTRGEMGPSDLLERAERQASGNGADARQAQAALRTARFALAHDRAEVLAKLEEIVSINEGLDDPAVVGRQLRVALGRDNLTDDPRLASLADAVDTGDTGEVVAAINEIAASAGLRRIGGDQRLGPDQVMPFDPKQHEALGQRPRDGQMALLVRPGYVASVDGEESVISRAVVMAADADDINRARQAEAGLDGRKRYDPHQLRGTDGRWTDSGGSSGTFRWLSPDDAMSMRQKMLADNPWTPEQREALSIYSGSAYGWMNGLLRGDPEEIARQAEEPESIAERGRELIRNAASAMRATPEAVKVKRTVDGYEAFGLDMTKFTREEAAEALKAMKGRVLQDPGFMSTSLNEKHGKETWLGRFKIELDVPAGAQGAYLDGDVGFEREHELLLAPGTRFEVTDVVIDPPHNTVKGRVVVP